MRLSLPILLALISLTACKSQKGISVKPGGLIGKANCFKIVNGATTNAHPGVTLILSLRNNQIYSTCTGTFIGPKTVLTAAHCIAGTVMGISRSNQIDMRSTASQNSALGTFISAAKVLNNDPTINSRPPVPNDSRSDVAVLIFSTVVAPEVIPLLDRQPVTGDQATLVGFGNDNTDPKYANPVLYKRFGHNTITVENPIGISVRGRPASNGNAAASDSVGASGDSGGPLLINGKVAGILALDTLESQTAAKNYYGNLSDSVIQNFLQSALSQGADFALPSLNATPGTSSNSTGTAVSSNDCLM